MGDSSAPQRVEGCLGCFSFIVAIFIAMGLKSIGISYWVSGILLFVAFGYLSSKIDKIKKAPPQNSLKRYMTEGSRGSLKADRISQWESDLSVIWTGSKSIEFQYVDKNGDKTDRKIILKDLSIHDRSGSFVFHGFCELRGADRTFMIDSIVSDIKYNGKKYDPYLFIEDNLGVIVDAG